MEDIKEKSVEMLKIIVAVAIIVTSVYFIFFREVEKNDPVISEYEQKQNRKKSIKDEMIEKNNGALVFDDQEFSFSQDIQDKMDASYLIDGDIYDIYGDGEKYFVKVNGYDYFGIFEISNQNIEYIRNSESYDNFFIIAKFYHASKSLFEVESDGNYEDSFLYEDLSDKFLLKGELINISKIN